MTTFSITIPDLAAMSDDEVDGHILSASRDGRWSAQTRWLLKRFGTELLDLGEAWAQTWTGWACPVCGRSKVDIARLTSANVLLCQLDEHHDHIRDFISDTVGKDFRDRLPDAFSVTRRRAFAGIFSLVERFEPTLICIDCNAADAKAKKAIGGDLPRHFSFAPSEIMQFIEPRANQPHLIEADQAEFIWTSVKSDFEQRLEFAEMMSDRIARGLHDRELRSSSYEPISNWRLLHWLVIDQVPARNRPDGLADALSARSRSAAGKIKGSRKSTTKVARLPTADEFRLLDESKQSTSIPWRSAGTDWRCPTCSRNKFEIMRPSNSGAWTANVMTIYDYFEEQRTLSRLLRSQQHNFEHIFGWHQEVGVCQDCRQVLTDAGSLVPGADQNNMSLEDIAALISEPAPHRRHEIDHDRIISTVEQKQEWKRSVEDYWLHRTEALAMGFALAEYQVDNRVSAKEARRRLIPGLVETGKLPSVEPETRFDWLITEHRRFLKE
jgi:hypothetical protein